MKYFNLIAVASMVGLLGISDAHADSHEAPKTETDCKEHHGTWDPKALSCKVEEDHKDDHGKKKEKHKHDDHKHEKETKKK